MGKDAERWNSGWNEESERSGKYEMRIPWMDEWKRAAAIWGDFMDNICLQKGDNLQIREKRYWSKFIDWNNAILQQQK